MEIFFLLEINTSANKKSISVSISTDLSEVISIVQGDTTSSYIGGLVAFYNKIEVIYLEAGLRSNNVYSSFPEGFNRKALPLITNVHLTPTEEAKANLQREHVGNGTIHVTGNNGIDTLFDVKQTIEKTPAPSQEFDSQFGFLLNKDEKVILVTLHRRESFEKNIKTVMQGILELAKRSDMEFLIPLHLNPEVRKTPLKF